MLSRTHEHVAGNYAHGPGSEQLLDRGVPWENLLARKRSEWNRKNNRASLRPSDRLKLYYLRLQKSMGARFHQCTTKFYTNLMKFL